MTYRFDTGGHARRVPRFRPVPRPVPIFSVAGFAVAVVAVVTIVAVAGLSKAGTFGVAGPIFSKGLALESTPLDLDPLAPTVARSEETSGVDAADLAQRAALKVVSRHCGVRTSGTGFVVEHGSRLAVVTNQHVLGGGNRLSIVTDDGEIDLEVTAVDAGRDLAVVEISTPQVTSINRPVLSLAAPGAAGARLVLAGFPRGRDLAVVDGSVQTTIPGSAYGFEAEVTLIHGAAEPGMSGGPVLDERGSLTGVVAAVDYTTGLVVAVSSLELASLLSPGVGVPSVQARAC